MMFTVGISGLPEKYKSNRPKPRYSPSLLPERFFLSSRKPASSTPRIYDPLYSFASAKITNSALSYRLAEHFVDLA